MRVGRNEACPCGSGKKYKSCCEGKARQAFPRGLLMLFVTFAVIAAIAFYPRKEESRSAVLPSAPAAPAAKPGPQPGPAPPGKVWSVEHGHWHDAAPAQSPIRVEQTSGAPLTPTVNRSVPQPAGPVPPGKVWSAEHGHWHDAPK